MSVVRGRLNNVVILRTYAIVAVVMYHCFCPWLYAWDWIDSDYRPLYSFIFEGIMVGRMPLFICVSGYLFSYLLNERGKYKTFKGFISNKTKRLLLPCFLFTIVTSVTFGQNVIIEFLYGGGHLWFLKMLYLCFILCWLLGRFIKGKWQYLCLLISIILMFAPEIHFFAIGQFTKYFVFFYFGFLLCKNREELKFIIDTPKALILHSLVYLCLSIVLAYLYCNNSILASEDIIHKNMYVKYLLVLMRGYTIILAFSIVNNAIKSKDHISRFFDTVNSCSYGIYLFHCYFLNCIKEFAIGYFQKLSLLPPFLGPLLVFIIIFSLSFVLTYLIRKTSVGRYLL